MVRPRKHPETVRITPFAKDGLDKLVDRVSTTPPILPVDGPDLVGALIYAASRSPLEAIKANIGAYRDVEIEMAAVEALGMFLRHFGG